MYHIDFERPCHVHFIGIGGISMSGLAEILLERGFTVSGSDARESELTKKLEAHGAKLFYGQKAENIQDGIDVVVYTAAIHPDNPEFQEMIAKMYPEEHVCSQKVQVLIDQKYGHKMTEEEAAYLALHIKRIRTR